MATANNTNSSLIMPIGACSESCVLGTAQAKETMSVPVEVGYWPSRRLRVWLS